MTRDPTEGFPTTPNGEGSTDLPFLGRHSVEAPPTSTTTTPRPGNSSTDQATRTILPRQETPRSDANLSLEQRHACREAAQQWSNLAGGQAAMATDGCEALQHKPSAEERILMMDYIATRAQFKGVLPPPVVDGTWPRLPWPFHVHSLLMRWTTFTPS
jgi:hypothetical protein